MMLVVPEGEVNSNWKHEGIGTGVPEDVAVEKSKANSAVSKLVTVELEIGKLTAVPTGIEKVEVKELVFCGPSKVWVLAMLTAAPASTKPKPYQL